ncbi:hypothetical protein OR16_16832 [Cupriavidus basilensis OR16]|uniref:Uncharacterized protein n=1 Tax=Cupriavidus basilensis OR16 TaxID=1127483 RepID=H1S660_9BURK|nr:hypothetical protein OR16_16832 [Cupriavidus basilensis OR16]
MRAESGEMPQPVTGTGISEPSRCRQVCSRISRWRRSQSIVTATMSPASGSAAPGAGTCRIWLRSGAYTVSSSPMVAPLASLSVPVSPAWPPLRA